MNKSFRIGSKTISRNSPVFIVAEISANHNQDYNRALEIIHAAGEAGADAVKLQTYTPDSITLDCDDECFQINEGTIWDGTTLYKLYSEAFTPWEWQPRLKEEAKKLGLECFSSPFDLTSVDFLEEMDVPAYKIASYEINDIPLIRKIARLHKPMIFATGIAYPEDIRRALDVCVQEGCEDVILLKCTSSYPTPYEAVNLNVIPTLAKTYDCLTGISDHTMGTIVSAGAIPLGAKMVEKHLTLRRADGGPDGAFSMEPEEFRQMVQQIRILEKALGSSEYVLTDTQKLEHEGSRSLFVVKDIEKGDLLSPENIRSIRPGNGLHTMYYEEVLGKRAKDFLKKGTPLAWELIE
ncbi:MAG: pseudaminic acid synthase [Lachnospiraceae bacterium]|jgi:N-acetylneuraminate synthase/pseudaminic acid synthase|nr:pseudaminic acid synthase [Lachnospiraceae bacterium]MDE6977869.1 pseudaminic acid synthase [Lachnospiraceae bacterium]